MSAHLTDIDLKALFEDRPLDKERIDHLEACVSCQKLVERLDVFDPKRGAREVFRAVRRGQIERPESMMGTVALMLFFLLALTIAIGVSRTNGLGRVVDFEEGRAEHAEKALGMVCSDYLALRARASDAGLPLTPIPELTKDWPICAESPR